MFDTETKITSVSDNTLEGFVQKVQTMLGEKKKIVCVTAIVAICEESSTKIQNKDYGMEIQGI